MCLKCYSTMLNIHIKLQIKHWSPHNDTCRNIPFLLRGGRKKKAAVEGKNLKAFGLGHYSKTSSTKHLKAAFH